MTEDLDAIAGRYYEAPPADEWIEDRVVRWIMPKIIGWCTGRVLEMGYGAGRTTEMLLAAGVDVEVVEGSAALVARARMDFARRFPGQQQIWLSKFENFDPSDWGDLYDTVLCLHVLEHVEDPVALLRRVRGWLKPGGRLIVVTPNATSIHRRVGRLMTGAPLDALSDRDRLVGHVRVYVLGYLWSDVERAGFRVDGANGWFLKPTSNARMVDWPPEHIDALCEIGWGGIASDAANILIRAFA